MAAEQHSVRTTRRRLPGENGQDIQLEGTPPTRRALLGAGAAAVAFGAGTLTAAARPHPDAALLALAAEIREAERQYGAACDAYCAAESADDGEGMRLAEEREEAAAACLEAVIARMAATPAETSTGIVVKAARIAWSLRPGDGGAILFAERPLVASLLADIARLAPAATAEPLA